MPDTEDPPASPDTEEQLQSVPRWCKWVRLLWCDSAGVRRCRVVPAARIRDAAIRGVGVTQVPFHARLLPQGVPKLRLGSLKIHRPTVPLKRLRVRRGAVAPGCMAMAAHVDSPAPDSGLNATGETRIVPDLATLKQLPWRETSYVALVDMKTESGEPWDCCPRNALRRALAKLEKEFGITLQVGYETEFYLLREAWQQDSSQAPAPLDDSNYCQSSALDAAAEDIEAIVGAVQRLAGVTVEQYHAEGGSGQFELATQHMDAFVAADALVLTREALVATAAQRGRPATLLPKPFQSQPASGAHLHFSLHKNGKALMSGGPEAAGGMQEPAEHFLAGVLGHLPGLLSFLAASPNSYRRLVPSHWTGAFQTWGINNREAALRFLPGAGNRANCELKTPDATANPHIALAAIVTAGLLGLRRQGRLPEPVDVDPGSLTREERQYRGIRRLPDSLTAALDTMKIDKDLMAGLRVTIGAPLLTAYTAVKRSEAARFRDTPHEEEQAELLHRY